MAPNNVIASARPAVTSYYNLVDLTLQLQRFSLTQRRSLHASRRYLAGVNLHAPADTADKTRGLSKPTSSSTSKPQVIVRSKIDTANERAKKSREEALQNRPLRGGLAPNSIFSDEISTTPSSTPEEDQGDVTTEYPRNPESLARVLNPRPRARALWQRKMLLRSIRKRGRLTKDEKILQTERSSLSKSHFFKTSIKKLAPLARQIAGKTIDEAILQMRFSKKKVAQDVREHLIHARNEAIVAKGMGLGSVQSHDPEALTGDTSIVPLSPRQNPTLALKKGLTPDPTQIYIAQAWVNRGPYGKVLEPRAMGRANILRPPSTGLSILLKEERTRTREKEDKEAKEREERLGSGHWRQLRDRKVPGQRPFYSW